MQSYLQYRRLGTAVRKQLADFPQQGANSVNKAENVINENGNKQTESTPSDSDSITEAENASASDQIRQDSAASEALGKRPTCNSEKTAIAHTLPGIEVRSHVDDSSDRPSRVFVVGWDGVNDPQHPRNYSLARRLTATLIVSALGFIVGAASSINSGVLPQNNAAFGISDVVGSLVDGLYLLGFAFGSLFSGPLSEILGRNLVYIGSLTLFMIFVMGSALAPNIGAQLAFRFLSGIFGCPPLTCAGGTIADLFNPIEKTIYFPMYAVLSFGGPVLGPVLANYVGQTGVLSWRWSGWIILIGSGLVMVLIILFQPETYAPLLLHWKGKQLRKITGDKRFRSEMDLQKLALFSRIGGAMKRQFLITIHEPIILLISLYMTVLYIVLFTFFDGYTYIFTDTYGISQGLTNIIWAAMYVGILLCAILVPIIHRKTKKDFTAAAMAVNGSDPAVNPHALDGVHTEPEIRLFFAMFGAPLIPISLFWMGWTDFSSVSIWSPIIASSCFGLGTICVFISSYMYVIDSYDIYAASALGFMTVSRYCAAGGMTVVGMPFYKNMGVHWTLTILGCISAIMVPVPYVFYKFGPVIRRWSKYAVTNEVEVRV
ncbi:uncharacterized protein N7484_007195 [Penicillium longicatenatum]|uniref:uncharacterized protein n=1 Tax=Penicillium longicatenatum TaxID=1561947 RepID=UPI002546D5EE|nr:uncharacterized protein N7484_007195 [Penicillium longicatenatum]KAJ5639333.1 hypothetical protein N7484_007195 [Penicillium longicatenatum]